MTRFAESYAVWLADYYLLATVLLALALTGITLLKQPALRLMVTKSTLVALVLLAILCAVPGWSVVHLLAADRPATHVKPVYEEPVSHADAVAHPELNQSSTVRRAEQPALLPQAADETLIKVAGPKMSWAASLAIAHLASMGCIAVWLALGWVASVRLRKTAQTAPAHVSAILSELASHNSRASNPLQLFTHDRIDVAVALGVWQPMILLPDRWANSQSHDRLQAVLAHEATHVLNYDLQWVALARISFVALWANPLFWLTKLRLRLDQEALADAAAAEITSRQQYAEQLVAWARDARSRPALHLSSAVGLWEGPSQLRQRIAILLDERLTVVRDCSCRWRLASFTTSGILAIALSLVTLRLAEPLPALADEKQSTPASGEKKDAKPKRVEMDTLKVAVVDANDQPIKGAKVKPYGMRSNNDGSHYGWFGENELWGAAQETTTDDEGIAAVRYPRTVDEEKPVTKVSLQVSHPDFVAATPDVPIGGTPSKVRMQHGGVVEITVAGGEKPNIEELFGVGGAGDIKAWTRTKDGKLRSPHLAEQNTDWAFPGGQPNIPGQDVRAVWLPKNGPPQFSSVEHVQIREGETQSIEVRLKPGVKLAGSLAADVPRPIVGGRVVVNLDTPGYTDWQDWAPVNEDGTFEFASLPSDDEHDLQIMAYCEGSISTTGAEDGSQLKPQKLRLTKDMSDYVVEMEPTATAVVKLLDPNGKPVSGAKVAFSPNIFWSNGSNIVNGSNYRSRDWLHDPEILNKMWKERPGMAFQATTDEQGVAKVDNLPAYPYEMMQVFHDQFQLPKQKDPGAFRYFSFMKLSPGGTAEETITLETKRNNDQQKPRAKPANDPPVKDQGQLQPPRPSIAKQPATRRLQPNTIIGRVVDEKGQPIPSAEVFLFRINRVDRSRKLQAKTTTDAEGKYRFENVIDIPKEIPDGKLFPFNPLEEQFVQVFVRAPSRTTEMRMDLRQRIAQGAIFDLKLSSAAKLTGRITGPDGKPVAGALVSVGGAGYTTWEGAASARTKADGTYVVDDVPPYGVEEYRKKAADEKRRLEAFRATSSQDSFAAFVAPPMITVAHPDFATKTAIYNKIPGEQDVQLEPAAVIEGRVVLGDTNKPAGGVTVKLNTAPPKEVSLSEDTVVPNYFGAEARTDADGKYRFASLPAGNYDLSAEKRNWVDAGVEAFAAASGKTSTAPNLTLTPGGIISIRLINEKTGKPIPISRDTRADISAHLFPLITKWISHPSWIPQAAANTAGRFELHAPPGKRAVFVGLVYEGEQTKWINKQSRTLDPQVVDIVEGKTVEVDIPVIEMPKDPAAAITGRYQPISPVKVPDEQPKKSSSDDAANKPDKNDGANSSAPKTTEKTDGDDDHGSQMLRNIRTAAAPLLAAMAKEHGYGLKPGQDLARIAPPFAPIRMEYYRVGHPSQSEAIGRGPSAMLFRWTNGHLQNWGMTFGDSADSGYDLIGVLDAALGFKSQSIEGAPELLKAIVPGDWVVRTGVEKAALAKQLEKILQNEMSLPIRLEFREVNRPVYVARGSYRLTPLPSHEATSKLILTDETLTTDEIQIFGKELVPNSGAGGGTDHFDVFLDWLGRWIGTPVVSEVTKKPSNQLSWHLNERSPSTDQTRREDHDPKLVLANITAQTGLEFVQENRPVKILSVERSQK